MFRWIGLFVLAAGAAGVAAQTSAPPDPPAPPPPPVIAIVPISLPVETDLVSVDPASNADRQAFFGDLHVHTTYSFDAFAFGTLATPHDAYRYAKGETILHPGGFEVKLGQPLDFYAVTDHGMFLGAVREAADPDSEYGRLDMSKPFHNLNAPDNMNVASVPRRGQAFSTFIPNTIQGLQDGTIEPELLNRIARSAWSETVRAAEEHNDPGTFTTFIAYEYTSSTDDRGNLHRNVVFNDADRVPAQPFSRFNSQNPEGLWAWMDNLREQGIDTIAIPHNSNGSNGHMFALTDWAGNPIDGDYARRRMRNEPMVEMTQVKGTSDTHPALSPNDEWANFEIMPYRIATMLPSDPPGSYVRNAYQRGLMIEQASGVNPYKFGMIGSSDTHTGASSTEEANFFSKVGINDSTPVLRGSVPVGSELAGAAQNAGGSPHSGGNRITVEGREYIDNAYRTWSAAGLAGVWAEENTRDAIFNAFRRKETFATSGPRIRVRMFAGYDFDAGILGAPDALERAYRDGITMGGDLHARGASAPRLLALAIRDPNSAALQRLQIVKGWIDDGEAREQVYDAACSDGLAVDPKTHRCPDNGAKVDLADCSITGDVGAAELGAVWQDPDFDPAQRAFYYVRVLENPTCRWSTWDALRANVAPRADLQKTIQERAWTSPIWYVPG